MNVQQPQSTQPQTASRIPGASLNSDELNQRMAALAALVATGDEPAFESLYQAMDPAVRAFFAKKLGSRTRAELLDELSQQTWLQAWQLLASGRYDAKRAPLKTFVFGISLNIWLRHQRASGIESGRRSKHENIQNERDKLREDDAPPLELYDFCITLEALRDCMLSARNASRFGRIEREILEGLRQGTTERQLGIQLSLAPSSVHGRKKAMLERLRRCLLRKGIE